MKQINRNLADEYALALPRGDDWKSNPKLRYMRKVALAKLLLINVVVDIYGLPSHIAPEFLDEFARHSSTSEMCGEPMPTAMWAKVVFHSLG